MGYYKIISLIRQITNKIAMLFSVLAFLSFLLAGYGFYVVSPIIAILGLSGLVASTFIISQNEALIQYVFALDSDDTGKRRYALWWFLVSLFSLTITFILVPAVGSQIEPDPSDFVLFLWETIRGVSGLTSVLLIGLFFMSVINKLRKSDMEAST